MPTSSTSSLFEALCVTLSASVIGVLIGRVGIEYLSYLIGARPPEGLFVTCLLTGLVFAPPCWGSARGCIPPSGPAGWRSWMPCAMSNQFDPNDDSALVIDNQPP